MNLSREELFYMYTSHFCEENIYNLTNFLSKTNSSHNNVNLDLKVVFISSKKQVTPFWNQKLCKNKKPVCWDYHVVLLVINNENNEKVIYDFDTNLDFPCVAKEYCTLSFNSPDDEKLELSGITI